MRYFCSSVDVIGSFHLAELLQFLSRCVSATMQTTHRRCSQMNICNISTNLINLQCHTCALDLAIRFFSWPLPCFIHMQKLYFSVINSFVARTSRMDGWSSVLRPRQHSIGYMGDGFYGSKDLTNSIKVLKGDIHYTNNRKNTLMRTINTKHNKSPSLQ